MEVTDLITYLYQSIAMKTELEMESIKIVMGTDSTTGKIEALVFFLEMAQVLLPLKLKKAIVNHLFLIVSLEVTLPREWPLPCLMALQCPLSLMRF